MSEALTLWGKHLAADVVTPMSLPLPWWTLLYERPERDLRSSPTTPTAVVRS